MDQEVLVVQWEDLVDTWEDLWVDQGGPWEDQEARWDPTGLLTTPGLAVWVTLAAQCMT